MTAERLLHALADGRTHSGEALAREFGVTRAAIWKQAGKLAAWGLTVDAMRGEGYRLARPLDLLDAAALRTALQLKTLARLAKLEVFTELGSTNRHLLRAPPPAGKLDVCVAEFQTAGRGRRGRSWSTPLGAGVCLSVGWHFAEMPAELPALTLAVGVVVRRVLERVAGLAIALKWPNDLVFDERKLGGILLELAVEAQGGSHVVAGIGLNVALPRELLAELSDWPRGAIDLATALRREPPPRLALVAALVDDLGMLFADYAATGFAAYRNEWRSGDYLRGRAVRLDEAAGAVTGTALGIDLDGALLVETAAGVRRRIVAGDVSVRSNR
ncbi:MAG TPA: biotin--[acetyl-CoA-carboxylase] ligase [Gammaproteobacteria bacterium]|nr:biotin--[acetyl-CoA-carboxylase] ligase [Gammaproteobacteria bacterium]